MAERVAQSSVGTFEELLERELQNPDSFPQSSSRDSKCPTKPFLKRKKGVKIPANTLSKPSSDYIQEDSFVIRARESLHQTQQQQQQDLQEFESLEHQIQQETPLNQTQRYPRHTLASQVSSISIPEVEDDEQQTHGQPPDHIIDMNTFSNFDDSIPWEDQMLEEQVLESEDLSENEDLVPRSNSIEKEEEEKEELPPRSELVEQLFQKKGIRQPTSKPRISRKTSYSKPKKVQALASEKRPSPAPVSDKIPPAIQEKMNELDAEINKYKQETKKVKRETEKLATDRRQLEQERNTFQKKMESEKQTLASQYDLEMKKLKKERQKMERQIREKAKIPDRKERAEIEALKAQITKLELEEKSRVKKSKLTQDRLKSRIKELEQENKDLAQSLKTIEEQRIQDLKSTQEPSGASDIITHFSTQPIKTRATFSPDFSPIEDESAPSDEPLTKFSLNEEEYDPTRYQSQVFSRSQQALSRSTQSIEQEENQPPFMPVELEEKSSEQAASVPEDRLESSAAPSLYSSSHFSPIAPDTNEYTELGQSDGKRERKYRDGRRILYYKNGTEKEFGLDGTIIVRFSNGDIKTTYPDRNIMEYYYHQVQTKMTTYPNQTKVYEFPNKQVEMHYVDGSKEIHFPDGTRKQISPNGREQTFFIDGTTMIDES